MINKNALRRVSLACLEISQEMGVINSARNRISSLKVLHFLLYPRSSIWFSGYLLFISYSTLFEYACINTQKSIRGKLPHFQKGRAWPLTKLQVTVEIIGRGEGGEGLPMPRHCVIMIFCRTTVSARLETITRTHWLKDKPVHNINKIKCSMSQLLNQLKVLC